MIVEENFDAEGEEYWDEVAIYRPDGSRHLVQVLPALLTLAAVGAARACASTGLSGRGERARRAPPREPASRTRKVALAPMPAGGLSTSGKPTCSAKARPSSGERKSRCRATGSPASRRASFIFALSRKSSAVATLVPGFEG